jgi:hypothetical protein
MRTAAIVTVILVMVPTALLAADTTCPPRCLRDCGLGCVVGAGPDLATDCGANFDCDVLKRLYKLNCDLTLTAQAGLQSPNQDMRNFSRRLISARNDMNAQIARCLQAMCCEVPCPDGCTGACVKQCLLCSRKEALSDNFARVMRMLLRDSEMTARLASIKAQHACVRSVLGNAVRTSMNDTNAFALFLREGFLTQQDKERYCIVNPTDPRCPM